MVALQSGKHEVIGTYQFSFLQQLTLTSAYGMVSDPTDRTDDPTDGYAAPAEDSAEGDLTHRRMLQVATHAGRTGVRNSPYRTLQGRLAWAFTTSGDADPGSCHGAHRGRLRLRPRDPPSVRTLHAHRNTYEYSSSIQL